MAIWKDFGSYGAFGDEFLLSEKIDPPPISEEHPNAIVYFLTEKLVDKDLTNLDLTQNPDGKWIITGETHFHHLEELSKEPMDWEDMVIYIKKNIVQYMFSLIAKRVRQCK